MKEPSIAGLRVAGERLSPDGKYVVYLWNAEGKNPRDLYLVPTSGGDAKKILSPSDLLTKKEEKKKADPLEYGVLVNDEFVQARRNQIGNLRWSPDSSKILFTQNGDIYIWNIQTYLSNSTSDNLSENWRNFIKQIERQTNLLTIIIANVKANGINEQELFDKLIKSRSELKISLIKNQGEFVPTHFQNLYYTSEQINNLQKSYPKLKKTESFLKLLDEWAGIENRANVARINYNKALNQANPKPKRITKTQSFEFSADFLDNDRILFQQSGNIFSINTKDGTLTQISREANSQRRISVFGATPSKDGSMMAYITSDGSNQRPLFVPNYLPYYTTAPTVRRGWTKPKIYLNKTGGSLEKPIEIKLPKQEGEAYISGLEWLADNKTLIVDRIDKTHKRRQMFVVTFENEKANVFKVHEEEDPKWIGRITRIIEANPKNANQFFFASEMKTGYNHLYLVNLDRTKFADGKANAEIKQLTNGNWEIGWADWTNEGKEIFYLSTEGDASSRNLFRIQLDKKTASSSVFRNKLKGVKTGLQLQKSTLIFRQSQWNIPTEIYAMRVETSTRTHFTVNIRKITNTTPKAFLKRKWNEPKFTEFNARDGKKVPAKIYFPANFYKSKKYPMAIFVHGAGYLQNVINGWNNYYREFMFNQLLTQKGYVVLDIDYRGSAGYGRDWRTDVYDFLGGKDYTDHVDGIDFMVKEYNIDVNRVGVYGGSYGGFMAAMLVMRSPDKIQAAAALRPVMDWKNYYAANPFYTSQRLGDPKKNPEAYKRSSPIAYASQLRKKLLILHGLLDANVHAQDSIQLVEQLMRLDKTEYFDLMLYPAERHSFQRSTSWEDEYERILELFEEELK